MAFLLPQLMVQNTDNGWICAECDCCFDSRDYALFQVKETHIYYDEDVGKWLHKITLEQHTQNKIDESFNEELRDFRLSTNTKITQDTIRMQRRTNLEDTQNSNNTAKRYALKTI